MRGFAGFDTQTDFERTGAVIAADSFADPLTRLIDTTLTGLGYELADFERSGRGLLRVFIDRPVNHPDVAAGVGIEDCERVSHQLTRLFEVENIDFDRLEVSSPGLDRPLRKLADYVRFAGAPVAIKLRVPFQGRKQYQGVLQPVEGEGPDAKLAIVYDDNAQVATRLEFTFAEVDKARLVPQLDFRSKRK